MKRFKLVNLVLTVILFTLIVASPVLAATYDYALAFSVKDTGGTARTYVPVLTGIGFSGLAVAGYATTTTGVVIYNGATAVTAMVGTTQTAIVLPSLPASNTVGLNLYTDYSVPWATQPIITGYGGYYKTLDAAALEPGNNFEFERKGYFDTTKLGNLIIKADAFRAWVSSSGNLSAMIYSNTDSVSQLVGALNGTMSNTFWRAQTFLSPATSVVLTNIYIYGQWDGANVPDDADIITCSLRATAAGLPSGVDLVSMTKTGAVWKAEAPTHIYTPATPYVLTDSTTYAVVVRTSSATKIPYWLYDNANPYANGQQCDSVDSGANWVAVAANDFSFKVQTNPYLTGACASGLRTIRIYGDGADFKLNVGGVDLDSTTVQSIPDNANDLFWGETVAANNPVIYDEYMKNDVGGAEVVWYQPNNVIIGTALPDRTGAAQDGVITFGANSNITVTMGAVTSYASVAGTSPGAGVAPTFQDANMPTGWFAVGTGATLPFYDSFSTAATGLGISTQSLYIMMMMAVALAVGLMAGIIDRKSVV